MRATVIAGTATLLLALPAPAAAGGLPLREPGAAGPLMDERLSNERTLTRYTRAARRATVWSRPTSKSRRITRLRFFTEDNFTEIYIALESRRIDGVSWVKVRVPMRPNGTTGWVPRWTLEEMRIVNTRMVIDRRRFTARLYRDGRLVWRSRVGVGKPGSPTPRGNYWVRERINMRPAGGVYGPYALGTSAYSVLSDWPGGGVVGIHGTNAPGLIPGRISHGCVRVPNHKVVKLKRLMPVGTPIRIR